MEESKNKSKKVKKVIRGKKEETKYEFQTGQSDKVRCQKKVRWPYFLLFYLSYSPFFFCRIRYSAANVSVWWEYGREIREVKKLRMKAGSQCSVMAKVINLIKLFDILFTVVPVIELIWGLFEKFLSLYFEKNSSKYQNDRWGANRWICSIRHF